MSRRRLVAELRRYRSERSLSVEDVAGALSWSSGKVCRIESGRRRISREDVRRLLVEYQVDDVETAAGLVAMAGPMYLRIAEDLGQKIESGELGRGTPLPTELELRNQYGASRKTVRDAVKWLRSRGLMPSECDNDTPRLAHRLAFRSALTRVQLLHRMSAKVRESLDSSLSIHFSRQTSVRDRMTGSRESLRGPTSLPVSCPNRGMAVAA